MRIDLGLVGLAGCFVDWILTRPWKYVALYFLPLVIAFSTVGLVLAGSWLNRDTLTDRYLKLADEESAAWEKQWAGEAKATGENEKSSITAEPPKPEKISPAAELLYRRVQQLQQNDARSVFFVAICYLQRGATNQGFAMLDRIAPTDRVGYLQAHAFLVEQMLRRPIKTSEIPIVRHHAIAALDYSNISPQLLASLSDLFLKLNDRDLSLEAMKRAAGRDSKYHLLLAQMASQWSLELANQAAGANTDNRGKLFAKLAEDSLEKAARQFKDQLTNDSQDVGARLMLADTFRLSGDLDGAEQTIREGMKLVDDPAFRSALSEVKCLQFVKTSRLTERTWTGNIELLEEAFRLDPNNMHIFEEVAKVTRVAGETPSKDLMDQLLNNLKEGRATSVTHMWIAEYYLNKNQFAKAVTHLEQAVKRDPTSSRCWNNLAFCLADLYPDRLEEALKYSDQAVALAPIIPDFHDTRGTILMKLKRPGDAVAAFERAIESVTKSNGRFQPQPAFHQRLAEAYTEVGDNAMADIHKQHAEKLAIAIEKAKADAQAKAKADAQVKADVQPKKDTPTKPENAAETKRTAEEPPAPTKSDGTPSADAEMSKKSKEESAVPLPEATSPKTDEPKPESPEPKPESPEPKPESPEPKPESPDTKPESPDTKPESPEPKPESPEPKPESPEPKPESPEPKPESPEPKPESPEPKPESPEPKPESPEPKPESPEPKPESPEPKPESPEPEAKPGVPADGQPPTL